MIRYGSQEWLNLSRLHFCGPRWECEGTLLETCIEEHGAAFCFSVVWRQAPRYSPDWPWTHISTVSGVCHDVRFNVSDEFIFCIWWFGELKSRTLYMQDKHPSTEPLSPSCSSLLLQPTLFSNETFGRPQEGYSASLSLVLASLHLRADGERRFSPDRELM